MKVIYQTVDGSLFDTEEQARAYEEKILSGLKMWNRAGREVHFTTEAFVLYMRDTNANQLFFQLARDQEDDGVAGLVEGEDDGLFYFDEWNEEYRYVDKDMLCALTAACEYVNKIKSENKEKEGAN